MDAKKVESVYSFGNVFFVIATKIRYGHLKNGFILLEEAKKKAMTELLPYKAKAEEKLGLSLVAIGTQPHFSYGYADEESDYVVAFMPFYNLHWFSIIKPYGQKAQMAMFSWCNSSFQVRVAKLASQADAIKFGGQLATFAADYEIVDHQFTAGTDSVHSYLLVGKSIEKECESLFRK